MASTSAPLPDHVAGRLAAPKVAARKCDVSFWQYLTLEEYDLLRPDPEGLREGTAAKYARYVRQIGRELHDDPHALLNESPPDWARILQWRDSPEKGGKARLEGHRRALLWLAGWWGQGDKAAPDFLRQAWNTKKAVARAKADGTYRVRRKFLQLPVDVQTLLAARPHERDLRLDKMWGDVKLRKAAYYLDQTFRTMVWLAFYTGARPSEFATLTLDNYQPERGGILGWVQPKDDGEPRDVSLKETFVWHSRTDPSLDHYLEHLRPKVCGDERQRAFFLTSEGHSFTETYAGVFLRDVMRSVLGERSTGPHGLRRACATWRYHHGWSIDEIALLLHDTPNVVKRSYLDWAWLRSPQGEPKRSKEARPLVPMLRSNGTRRARSTGVRNEAVESNSGSATEFSS